MKKLLFILLLAAAGAMSAGAAEPYAADSVRAGRYEKFEDPGSGKWGYKLDGRATVELDGREIAIDRTGREVAMSAGETADMSARYDWFEDPATGKFGFKYKDREVIPAQFDEVDSFNEGLATVKIDGKWGFIDPSGKLVIPARYDNVWYFREGLAAVEINGKWGYIDPSGNMVIPTVYDYAFYMSEGFAPVVINEKWGYIDRSGKMVIPAKYDDAGSFTDGRASVELNGRTFTIDRSGREIQ